MHLGIADASTGSLQIDAASRRTAMIRGRCPSPPTVVPLTCRSPAQGDEHEGCESGVHWPPAVGGCREGPGPGLGAASACRGGGAFDGPARQGGLGFQLRRGPGSVRLLQFPLHQLAPRPLGRPERQLGGELPEAGPVRHLRPGEGRALRQGQRGRRADLRGPTNPGGGGGLLLPGGGPLPRMALGHRPRHRRECPGLHGGPYPVQNRHRVPALGRRRRRREPRRVLERCAQGLGVCRRRAVQAEAAHLRGLLSRPGRGPGERDRHPGVRGATTNSR